MTELPPLASDTRCPPWRPGAGIFFDASACLPERFPGNDCGVCAMACPVGAIHLEEGRPRLAGDCLQCGQCAIPCPTGAIDVAGFPPPPDAETDGEEVLVDCWRVPEAHSPDNALRVPCLVGLGAGWLAQAAAAGVRVGLLDRGACGDCPAGREFGNLMQALTEARMALFEAGVEESRLPMLAFSPLDTADFHPPGPAREREEKLGRRAFFRRLAGAGLRGAEDLRQAVQAQAPEPVSLRGKATPRERLRLMTAIASLADRHGRAIPGRLLPQVSVPEGGCSAHGVCSAVCPTGALNFTTGDEGASLRFTAGRCVACGQCARTCPDQALRVQPSGGARLEEVLAQWEVRACGSCGRDYTVVAGRQQCPDCLRETSFAAGVASLFA